MKWAGVLILLLAAAISPGRAQSNSFNLTQDQADAVTIALVSLSAASLLMMVVGAIVVCCVCARCCEVFQCTEVCWPFNYGGPTNDRPDYYDDDYYTDKSPSTYTRRRSPSRKKRNSTKKSKPRRRSVSPATTVGSRPWEGRKNPYVYDEGYKPRNPAPPPPPASAHKKKRRARSHSPRPRYNTKTTASYTTRDTRDTRTTRTHYRTKPKVQVVDERGVRRARSIERIIVYGNGPAPMGPTAVPQPLGYAAAPVAPMGYGAPAVQNQSQVAITQLQGESWFQDVQKLVNSGQI